MPQNDETISQNYREIEILTFIKSNNEEAIV